jgi:flagellar hook protein FlgE
MSLFSTMRTSVSGMAAQSNVLSTIGDNIANSATTGYKDASTQFATVLGQNSPGNYSSGGVQTNVRYGITDQGTLASTTSSTDLAVNGSGFFVVSKDGQGTYMTRAGSFVPDSSGNLINAAGYTLMGYNIGSDGTVGSNLVPINVASTNLQVAATTTGTLTANLQSTSTVKVDSTPTPPITPPSDNGATGTPTYTSKTSMTVYDSLGAADVLDVYFTKTGDNAWDVDIYQAQDAAPGGGFPYAGSPPITTHASLTFDPTTGALASGSPTSITFANTVSASGPASVKIDLSGMTQLASAFGVTTKSANGNAPSKLDHVTIGKDGTLNDVYASGVQIAAYKIPLANVASPDNLTPLSGNVYQASQESGDAIISAAQTNGLGAIDSNTLEQSTVDLASELTNMIQAQRSYEANSKVLQAGSDLLGVLNRLTTN